MGLVESLRAPLALCISLSLLSLASAQVVGPTNGTFSGNPPQSTLQTTQVMGTSSITIYPLTNAAQEQLNVRQLLDC